MRRRRRGRSFFGPVLLIGLGVVFLLHNFGLGDWDAWTLIQRFWPILFVAAGLDIWHGRRSVPNALFLIAFTVALLYLIGAGLGLAGSQFKIGWDVAPVEISQPALEAARADIAIHLALGSLQLEALPESGELIAGTIYTAEAAAPDIACQQVGDTLHFVLRQSGLQFAPLFERWDGERAWRLRLNRDLPMRLTVTAGVGLNDLDLTGLHLTELHLRAGAGQTTVTLPARGRLQAHLHGGLGDLIIRIPKGLAVRLQNQSGLAETQIVGNYLLQDGLILSPDYDVAENRVDLTISGHAGLIKVWQID